MTTVKYKISEGSIPSLSVVLLIRQQLRSRRCTKVMGGWYPNDFCGLSVDFPKNVDFPLFVCIGN